MADAYVDIAISRSSKATHSVEVPAGQPCAWHVLVSGGLDIGFEVTFRPGGVESSLKPVQGAARVTWDGGVFRPKEPGTVVFTLDNSYSLMRGKAVKLNVLVGAPPATGPLPPAAVYDSESMNTRAMEGATLFFTNQFSAAEAFFAPLRERVPVFALGYGVIAFMRALMTFEAAEVAEASARLKAASALAETWMPKGDGVVGALRGLMGGGGTSGGAGGGPGLTPTQLEGTLIFSEASLVLALLNLMEESMLALVRTGLGIRAGWRTLQICDRALGGTVSAMTTSSELRLAPPVPGAPPAVVRVPVPAAVTAAVAAAEASAPPEGTLLSRTGLHIVGGVQYGTGVFNVLASTLPPIVLRVIAVLGFPCDRSAGMAQLRASTQSNGLRAPLAALFILAMHVLLPSFRSGDASEHVPEAEALLAVFLARFPGSALFMWMAGRLARMQGEVVVAKRRLQQCAKSQLEWPQLAQLSAYELAWCHAFQHDWPATQAEFSALEAGSNWSKVVYAFMQGAAQLQQGQVGAARTTFVRVLRLFGAARKLGNKVISAEQYAVRRAAEYVALTLPPAGEPPDDADTTALVAPLRLGPRLPVPAAVPPGSRAHALALAFPTPLLGLEAGFFWNGGRQMDAVAIHAGIAQVDAVLAAVASGDAFSAPTAMGVDAAPAAPWSAWQDACAGGSGPSVPAGAVPTVPRPTPAALRAALDAAAAAVPRGMPEVGGGGGGGGGGVMGRVFGSGGGGATSLPAYAKATPLLPAHAAAVAALVRGALAASVGLADEADACFGWIVDAAAANGAVGTAISLREVQAVAYAHYERGVLYADAAKALARRAQAQRLRAKGGAAAAAALAPRVPFVLDCDRDVGGGVTPRSVATASPVTSPAGAPSAPSPVASPSATGPRRQVKPAATAAAPATVPPPAGSSSNNSSVGEAVLASALMTGIDRRNACKAGKAALKSAREVRPDFNWKVRLHIRVHLSLGELTELRIGTGGRGGKAQSKAAAAAAAASWGDEADEAKLAAAAAAAAEAAAGEDGGADVGGGGSDDEDDEEEGEEEDVEADDSAVAGTAFDGEAMTPGVVQRAEEDKEGPEPATVSA